MKLSMEQAMKHGVGRAMRRRAGAPLMLLAVLLTGLLSAAAPVAAAPGLCVGPVCGDGFSRSAPYPWQLRMRMQDQWGHRERLVVDCRDGSISPLVGPVERGYAAAVGRRACRQAPLQPALLPPEA
ncbi:MAG: hypothetical protein ACKO45_13760 [Cyanobium sp.]